MSPRFDVEKTSVKKGELVRLDDKAFICHKSGAC